jgi:hypothetical protein
MKKYEVTMLQYYTINVEVEAENEQHAFDKVNAMKRNTLPRAEYDSDCDESEWTIQEIDCNESVSKELESEWKTEEHKKFARDMKKAGLEVYKYHGRSFYVGPAVNVSSIQDALSQTKVECRWDNMGRDHVVHPKY